MIFDAHIHLVPGVGGDPTDAWQSYQMIDKLNAAGVRGALSLTRLDPYRLHPVIYRQRCAQKISLIRAYIKENRYRIRPIFATELLYRVGIHKDFDITQFLIPKSRFLPLRFPAEPIADDWMRDLSFLVSKMRIVPIVCHFDEQYMMGNGERFANSSSLVLQISALSLKNKRFAKFVLTQMRSGRRFIIGSGAEIPEILDCKACYCSEDWSLDILQRTAHERLYLQNNDFRKAITPVR